MPLNRDRLGGWTGLITAVVMFSLMALGGIYGIYSLVKYILKLVGIL